MKIMSIVFLVSIAPWVWRKIRKTHIFPRSTDSMAV
jgi:hypothetical protein